MLPAYVFDKSIEKADDFASFKSYFKQDGDFYLLKPSEAGVSYLLGRERVPEKLDVFFDFSYPQSPEFFKLLGVFAQKHENYDVRVNFLAIRNESDELVAKGGQTEVEEFRRVASMDALYPHQVFNYLACRASQMQRGLDWWGDCAVKSEIDTFKVKEHLSSESGQAAMDERVRLTNELEILTGPTFVVNNTEIFGIVNVPALEEFEEAVLGKDNSMQENASQKNKKSMVNTGSVKS
jgi:hypothetical protein